MDIDKLPVQNDIVLPKFVENNSSETLLKVSQKGNIIETRREIFIPNKDGTLKKSVLTEQYANVSKRKHENKENEDPNKVVKRTRHQSQGLNEILEHMSGGNVVVKTKILAGVIDTQGADIAEGVAKCSKQIKQTNKFTKEKTAALISASNLSDYQLKQLRTACNKELEIIHLQVHTKYHKQEITCYQLIRTIGKQHIMTCIEIRWAKMLIKKN